MRYRDEDDKCYGIAGMAIGLAIFEAQDMFTGVTLDGDGLDCIIFVPQYYVSGNPAIPAVSAWQDVYQRYQVTMGLTIADTLCRKMLHDKGVVDKKLRKALLDAACEEGMASCQLENDEVENIFDKSFQYLLQAFKNSQVRNVIEELVAKLKERRSMSSCDIMDVLRALQ